MGNRAVITTRKNLENNGVGIYVHWCGSPESITAFLNVCKDRGYRSPDKDNYGWAYLAGVITNYFGDGLSCGVDILSNLDCDNYDNGVYIIEDWEIVGREYTHDIDDPPLNYDQVRDMEFDIISRQPQDWGRVSGGN